MYQSALKYSIPLILNNIPERLSELSYVGFVNLGHCIYFPRSLLRGK